MTADLIPDPPDYDKYLDAPHRFTDSGDGSCSTCGTPCDPFGLRDTPAFPEPVQHMADAPLCIGGCWHPRHKPGECKASLSPVRDVPCRCAGDK